MTKTKDELAAARVPKGTLARLSAIADRLSGDPRVAATGRVTVSAALRYVLIRGLEMLEAEFAAQPRRKRTA